MVKASEEITGLWRRYKATGDAEVRDRLILTYLPLVKYIADRISARLPRRVDIRDLRSAGIFGLIRAVEAFDLDRGIKFETYCSVRVRGSILDELRTQDWVPRPVRNRTQKLREAEAALKDELGRQASDCEVAEKLGIEAEDVLDLNREKMATTFVSLSATKNDREGNGVYPLFDVLAKGEEADPVRRLQRVEIVELVERCLDEKERRILGLYYYENLTMREIGRFLNLSESRVCQIHTRIMNRLKEELKPQETELVG